MVAKRRRRLKSQAETAQAVAAAAALAAPPDLATLPEDLHLLRELSYARAAANRFAHWLACHIAEHRIQLDSVMVAVKLLNIFVLESLEARVRHPHLFQFTLQDEHLDFWTPRTEQEAADAGLTVRRVRRGERRPPANLPGCAGYNQTCPRFRRYGERFCPSCRRAELERIRGK